MGRERERERVYFGKQEKELFIIHEEEKGKRCQDYKTRKKGNTNVGWLQVCFVGEGGGRCKRFL